MAITTHIGTVTGTVGETATQILLDLPVRANCAYALRVINPTNSHYMAVCYDNGTTIPVIGSVGIQLTPYGSDSNAYNVQFGTTLLLGVMLIADAAGVPYTIEYEIAP